MKKLGYIAIILVSIAWGLSFVATKKSLEVFSPISIMFFKFIFSSVFFTIFMFLRHETFKVKKTDVPKFLLGTLLGVVVYFYLEGTAIKMLNASSAALVLAIEPVVIMIASYFFNNERLTTMKKIAIFVSIVGVYFIVKGGEGVENVLGYFIMFLAVVMWSIYVVTSSKLTSKYSGLKIAGIQAYIALIAYAPLMVFQNVDYAQVELIHWLSIAFLGVIPSGIAMFLYVFSLKTIGNSTSSLFINFVPVIAAIFGFLFLGETLTSNKIIGGSIIITMITLTIIVDLKNENKLL